MNCNHIHSHSFRPGEATELLLTGVLPETVAKLSRWKSLTYNGHRQLSVPDHELTKPIFSYFDGKLSSIASILINGLSYCLVKLHTSLSSIATLFYLE